jgi:hypothetical protein
LERPVAIDLRMPSALAMIVLASPKRKAKGYRTKRNLQHRTLLHARVPRVSCPNCGVRKVATPWARASSGFTLLLQEAQAALHEVNASRCQRLSVPIQ